MNNIILNIIIVILIVHYILTFFMKSKLQNKIYVNNYIGKKYGVINDSIYVYGNKWWHIKQLIIIVIAIIINIISFDTTLFTLGVVVLLVLVDQIYRAFFLKCVKKNHLITLNKEE